MNKIFGGFVIIVIKSARNLSNILQKYSLLLSSLVDRKLLFSVATYSHLVNQTKGNPFFDIFEIETSSIHGMISNKEANALFYLASIIDKKGDVVEVGSWLGKSTVYLAKGCQVSGNGKVYAIDTFRGNPGKESMYNNPLRKNETILSKFKENIKKAGVFNTVNIFNMTSQEARKKINKPLRLVFVDGCHEYRYVKEDIQLWSALLVRGGVIALHDYSPRHKGTVKAINKFIVCSKKYSILVVVDSLVIARKK